MAKFVIHFTERVGMLHNETQPSSVNTHLVQKLSTVFYFRLHIVNN